jgi:anti-sigma regulatory factor (Ser/Thr protein kinase)
MDGLVGLVVTRARMVAGHGLADARRLAGVGAWEWDSGRDRFRVSDELAATWAPTLAELLERVEPDDRDGLCRALEESAAGIAGGPREVTFRLLGEGGGRRTMIVRCAPGRRRGRVIGATLDAGDREEAERNRQRAARAEALAEREHRVAQTLQRSLLPDRLPDVGVLELAARYLPGARDDQVGGDWYDVIELPSGEVALVMGDVVGRGITAAALVGKLRNALRAYALEGHEPGDVVERLNALLDRDGMEMATLLYLVFEPETGVVRWVNAGHPPPLVRRADGSREFWDDGRFVPLGALAAAGYSAATGVLTPGDMILLYTDGLVERPGVSLTTTLETLRGAAVRNGSADALCDATLASLLPGGPENDDVAMLAALVTRHADGPLMLELAARPSALREVRRRLERWLGVAHVPPALAARVVLCASEATANAVQHAYGLQDALVWVSARRVGGDLELRVRDEGHWREPPTQRRGRGLGLMSAFADEVELDHDDEGTVVTLRWRG